MLKKIAYITDIHLDEAFPLKQGIDARSNWNLILEDVKSRQIDEIIFGGDIGEKDANKWFFDSLKKFKIKIVLGNHDEFSTVINYHNPITSTNLKELYYAYEEGAFKFVFMDSSSGNISTSQFLWFQEAIKTDKQLLLFVHHPIFPVATIMDTKYCLLERSKLQDELNKLENRIFIFCGHYHMVDEMKRGNIQQILSPAGSYQVTKLPGDIKIDNTTFGYRVIEINHQDIKTAVFLYHNNTFVRVRNV